MTGDFYKLGMCLALTESSLLKAGEVIDTLARMAEKAIGNEGREFASETMGVEQPTWRKTTPIDAIRETAADIGIDLGLPVSAIEEKSSPSPGGPTPAVL